MKKLLWISPYVPYDQVRHAGGKTHNYYIKYFQKSGYFDIHLVTLALHCEQEQIDLDKYGISYDAAILDGGMIKNGFRIMYNMNSVFNNRHRLCHVILSYQYKCLKNMVKKYAEENTPDIVVMQWTGAAFLLPVVKQLFPGVYTVIIEEDVTFQGYERKYLSEMNKRRKNRYLQLYKQLKKKELELLTDCDLVVLNNNKDRDLLGDSGISSDKMYVGVPYYEDFSYVTRENPGPEILYYGVMNREENHQAAMWLIQKVMPLISDLDVRLNVVGNGPSEELKKLESEHIHITGYVEDISGYFAECMCLAVPLQLGAGIKVKILEGMSAGMPVLTNAVGIEGIPARNGEDFYYCETPEEYAIILRKLYNNGKEGEQIGNAAKAFMQKSYNIDKSLDGLIQILV